jgi:hypothetical protein
MRNLTDYFWDIKGDFLLFIGEFIVTVSADVFAQKITQQNLARLSSPPFQNGEAYARKNGKRRRVARQLDVWRSSDDHLGSHISLSNVNSVKLNG